MFFKTAQPQIKIKKCDDDEGVADFFIVSKL